MRLWTASNLRAVMLVWTLCATILPASGCASSAGLTGVRTNALPPAPTTPGAIVTNDWSYERDGELVTKRGRWVHLPEAEAGELLLWIERAEEAP